MYEGELAISQLELLTNTSINVKQWSLKMATKFFGGHHTEHVGLFPFVLRNNVTL